MKNIVIIGCGNGIGLRTAQILSQENKIIGISRTQNPELNHPNINFHQIDIISGNLDNITFPEIVDGLVYTPGSINLKAFHKLSTDDFRNDFEINVLGSVRVIQKLLPNLKKSQSASIVLFSSVAVGLGMPFHTSVAVSKSAVEGLTRSLAAEFSTSKIRVNAIAPSLTDTNLASQLLSSPEKREASAKRHPLQRIGAPGDIAELTAFLISEKSSWITGQVFAVDGGISSLKL
ncbi:oxidoreductase [Elizabethkingia meningoseptica]|uniref:Oxidoreductase n=1 Tax=Elizabethkingia meningoseptica TaxID=238 RepID=A0A1V3TWM9_ELIME|nr:MULTISPECIES: SDR family oxidoreductase [Elizabethkingia]AQX12711.1 oxidoreductase [Elizabethkingia meningoseptica]MBG0514223.1 SDR family oxidoreductase [Elizabethkingia meningoseptica]MDE5433140.1 SDR family oxidoreductase [Elizabethkingia meningoseptica]MDE5447442.1 SDR family oxidoreductase [Elizabethkingia meningoseptica]MDE5471496.1 SDR family oxidoreductase [Elizabethkingia meningoseptica]